MNTEIALFQSNDGMVSHEVDVRKETVWLTRAQIATLFDRDIKTVGKHINNALNEEMDASVVENLRQLPQMEKHTKSITIIST